MQHFHETRFNSQPPSDILMGSTTSRRSLLSSATSPYSPDDDIILNVPSAGYNTLSFTEFCTRLSFSQEANHAKVTSVTRWVNGWGVPHRFLILHVVVSTCDRNLFFRLERRRGAQELFVSSSSQSTASDGVLTSRHLERLLGQKVMKEAELKLAMRPPLVQIGLILQAVVDICPKYRLFREDCWFVASVVQEILCNEFGGTYEIGKLNDSRRKKDIRIRICQRLEQLRDGLGPI